MKMVTKKIATFLVAFGLCSSAAQANVPCSVPFTFSAGTVAVASQVNSNLAAIITCLLNAAQSGANSDITSITGLTTPLGGSQGGTSVFIGGTSTGSANAQVIATTTPNSFTLAAGNRVTFIAGFSNANLQSAPMTLNVKSTGAVNVYRRTVQFGLTVAPSGAILSGHPYTVLYDGSKFVIDSEPVLVGETKEYPPSTSPPAGWVVANSQALNRTFYADLFAAIGTIYGAGDGLTTFNLPDFRGRVAVGLDTAGIILTVCPNANTNLGVTCGAQNQAIAQANLPNVNLSGSGSGTTGSANSSLDHTHNFTGSGSNANVGNGPGTSVAAPVGTFTTAGANSSLDHTHNFSVGVSVPLGGSGTALTTMQPTIVVQKIIRY